MLMRYTIVLRLLLMSFFLVCSASYATESILSNTDIQHQNTIHRPDHYYQFDKNKINDKVREYSQQGNHRTGSKVDKKSAVWLENNLKQSGYEVLLEPVPFERATANDAKVIFKTLTKRILLGMSLLNSEGTDDRGLISKLGGTQEDDVVPVFYYYVMLPSKKFSIDFLHQNREALERLVNSGRYPAIIVVTQGNKIGLAPFNINLRNVHHVPVILISSSFGTLLETESKINKKVQLFSTIKRKPTTAYNVIATLKGTDSSLKPLIVMVSRSAWWRAAAGRGTGVAAWLTIAEKLAKTRPKRTVIFVALTGNEIGHLGYDQFIKDNRQMWQHAFAWLYLGADIAANPTPQLYIKTNNQKLDHLVEQVLSKNHQTAVLLDHPLDFNVNVPAISFIGLSNGCYHLQCDQWPRAVNIDAELRFVHLLNQVVMPLVS